MTELEKKALKIATKAHRGQKDKAGIDYIKHPIAVALKGKTEKERIVGYLHDVIEDTDVTLDDLRKEFDDEIVAAVDAISRREGEIYREYILRVKKNDLAKNVKLYDLEHNSKERNMPKELAGLVKRYEKAKDILLSK